MSLELDEKYMRIALHMARRGLGQTSPNPCVGAVLVSHDSVNDQGKSKVKVIARAVTGKGGTPHGEPQAIDMAGKEAKGATLYVTLEPCNHQGRTPPCTQAIIEAGIKRVVIASTDLDERVKGTGIAMLRQVGIEVATGICKDAADKLNAGHFSRQKKQRPFIIVKSAVSSDELVMQANKTGPGWVTSPLARKRGHLLRAEVDAILVGRTTALADNPTLTCRLQGMADRNPQPIIIDSKLALPDDLSLFHSKTGMIPWVIAGPETTSEKIKSYAKRGAEIITCSRRDECELDLVHLAKILAENGITRLLVEGGPTTIKAFLEQGLVDQINIFKGSEPLKTGGILPFGDKPLNWPQENLGFIHEFSQKLCDNMLCQYKKAEPDFSPEGN